MFKKALLFTLFLLGSFSLYAQEQEIPWQQDITMLMVPRETTAIQIAQDISCRYPVLLVCYQLTPAEPVLHAWDGEQWVGVSLTDYTNGTFFTNRPQRAVIIEKEAGSAPNILAPGTFWCDRVNRLASTDPRIMIHLLGRTFDFPYRYWMQFAKRYNYELEEINPALINVPWVHYRGDQVVAAFKARDFDRDMNKWLALDGTPVYPAQAAVITDEPDLPAAETPTEEVDAEPIDMPTEESVDESIVISVDNPETRPVKIIVETPEPEALKIDVKKVEEPVSEKSIDQTDVEEMEEPVEELIIDPFSTDEIPAAELIVPPAE